ncbi:glycosyltransferase [Clostridium estertheticum]|uniref:glycosyltransferase family 2 protein n=1 Tax=Clostridium estertheticum TaxID=238834 RepID=UPI0013E984EC|nr:glycosyltransferase [Clostridium estertheticum]MBZ9687780.1 glycosyltransferase [Clostridium estertheticum]
MSCSVSVVVPIYKVEEYIDKCITSILCQTFRDIEIILVDDGSPDKCGQVAESYANQDLRIKVIHKENGGLSSARNVGLGVATGDYILFVDSDDWIDPTMIEKMYNASKKVAADLVICNYRRVYKDREEENCLHLENQSFNLNDIGLKEYFYSYYFPYVHGHEVTNKLYKREIIIKNDLKFEKNVEVFSEDLLFNLYFLCHINVIFSLKDSLYNYLQRDNSIMHSSQPNLKQSYILFEKFSVHSEEAGKSEELKEILPLLFYVLIQEAIYYVVKSGEDINTIHIKLKEISKAEIYRKNTSQLITSKATKTFFKKRKLGVRMEIKCRLFSLICLCNFYYLIAAWKYYSINGHKTKTSN